MSKNHEVTLRRIQSMIAPTGLTLLDVLDALEETAPIWVPEGYYVKVCGSCRSSAVVPDGKYLKKVRTDGGCSQREVAAESGCTKPHLSDIEHNRRRAHSEIVDGYYRAIAAKMRQPEPPPRVRGGEALEQ